jgi:hypothetical protein
MCRAAGAECSVGVGWEEDVPELRGGSGEFDGNEGALGIHLRGTDNMSLDALLGFWIFDSELGARRQTLGKNDHGTAGAHGVRIALDGISFAREIDKNGHPEKDALSAATLLIGLRADGGATALDLHAGCSVRCVRFLRRCQSSNPQNSISGAMSSTPYSQPSGC